MASGSEPGSGESAFAPQFARWARRVRGRAAASLVTTGVAAGLVVGVAVAGALWKSRHGALRPWAAAAGLVGAAGGALAARRRRWDDESVALYLDGRLAGGEVVTTALGLGAQPGAVAERLRSEAATTLAKGDPRAVRPPVWRVWHGAIPVAAGAIVYLSVAPLPAAPQRPAPVVGADRVQLAEVAGLDKVEALAKLRTPDPEQRKRLDQIARDAAALREKLSQGMERREALSELARLQDAVQNERLDLGDGERRQGLEAALGRLAQEKMLADAARALGDRDLVRFDEEMQKLANGREQADREQAKKALAEAAEAARKNKAEDVARALERQRDLLDKRGQESDELKAFGDALRGSVPEDQQRELDGQMGDRRDAKKSAKALGDALKKLTPEQRRRLADNLKKKMQQGEMAPSTRDRLRDLAKDLESPDGQQRLEDELRRLADEDLADEGAEGQEGLDDAQRGLGQAQGELGAPVPIPMDGKGGKGDKGQGDGKSGDGKGKGGDGKGDDGKGDGAGEGGKDSKRGDTNEHQGKSRDIDAPDLRSRAKGKLDGRAPSAGLTIGRGAGREGDTANRRGTGALGQVGPTEVGGVDGNEVPEEYREQIGRYFQP